MTAVPRPIDLAPQASPRRAAARDERSGGEGFAAALGARGEKPRAAEAGGAADEAPSPQDVAGDSAVAGASPSDIKPGTASGSGDSTQPRPEGLAAILAAFEAAPRQSVLPAGQTRAKDTEAAATGPATSPAIAAKVSKPGEQASSIGAVKEPFAGLSDSMPDDARTDLFRRVDATAAAVFDDDAAPLRFAAQGHAAPGSRVRADFVSMRTDFAPAGRGDDRGAVAATFAARTGALGRPAADGVVPANAVTANSGDDAAAGIRAGATTESAQKTANTGAHVTEDALPPVVRLGSVEDDGKRGDTATERAVRTESFAVSAEPAAIAGSSTPGPTAAPPPMRQVASALGTAFGELRAGPDSAETAGNLRLRAGGAALKTVQIQLQPAHFGKVDVTLKLIDGHLAIQLMATEAETVMRLKDDTEGLKSLLSQSGFAVDDAAISIGLRDPGQARTASPPGFADNVPNGGSSEGGARNGDASQNPSGGQRGSAGQGGTGSDGQGARAVPDARGLRSDLDRSVYL